MVRSFLPKAALLLVLILLLAAPVAQAAEPGTQRSPVAGLVAQAWDFLTRLWAENGCRLDPNGRCTPEPEATPEADNGCRLDPSGGCAS